MNPIQSLNIPTPSPAQLAGPATAGPDASKGSTSFKDFLLDSIRDVNSMQQDADKAVEKLVTGGDVNPAEVLTAVQKADMAFRMMIQVRNKMVQAYEEIKKGGQYKSTVINNSWDITQIAVNLLVDYLEKGEEPKERDVITGTILVNAENVGKYFDPNAIF